MRTFFEVSRRFRLTLLVLGVMILTLTLAACGGETTPTTGPQTTGATSTGSAATALAGDAAQPSAGPTGGTAAATSPAPGVLFTPGTQATPPATTPAATVAVVDPNLKGNLVIWY